MITTQRIWLIWRNEHGAWWRPGSMGYTRILSKAGRYTHKEASEIVDNANRYQREGEIPNEAMLLSPEAPAKIMDRITLSSI